MTSEYFEFNHTIEREDGDVNVTVCGLRADDVPNDGIIEFQVVDHDGRRVELSEEESEEVFNSCVRD